MRTVTANCRHCTAEFQRPFRRGGTQRFCSQKCCARYRYLRLNDRPEKPCRRCGTTIASGSHANKDYCSKACKKAVDADQALVTYATRYGVDADYTERFRRIGHARRARLRGSRVETFSPITVLERDGWVCQLCGVDTPRELRGTKARNAPTLDHVVPIAKGGEHSMANTQCACLRCNTSKGAKLLRAA